jgi:hypothetical protein
MKARNIGVVTMVMAVALLLPVSNWGIFGGGEALALATPLEECQELAAAAGESTDICLVNFKCYVIARGTNLNERVRLCDQFHDCTVTEEGTTGGEQVTVRQSQLICTPAEKCTTTNGTETCVLPPAFASFHLKCYDVVPAAPPVNKAVTIVDQFETERGVLVEATQYLCEGAIKIVPEP